MTAAATLASPALETETAVAWDTEVLILQGSDRAGLIEAIAGLSDQLQQCPDTSLGELACALNTHLQPGGSRLAIVAGSIADVQTRLARAQARLADPACEQLRDTTGIYWFERPLGLEGEVAFLFPGEGAQYPGMLRDVRAAFPEAAAFMDAIDAGLAHVRGGEPPVSQLFLARDDSAAEAALARLDNAMLAVLIADGALHRVLTGLGLTPACAAGHSMGEMAALSAAGSVTLDEAFLDRFGATMQELQRQEVESDVDCILLAVGAGKDVVAEVLAGLDSTSIHLAMDNCPHQTVLVGESTAVVRVQEELQRRGVVCERLPFRRPYHTPLFEPMLGPLRELFAAAQFQAPEVPVYSCTTAEPFSDDPAAIRELAVQHWAAPVRFTQMIQAMHDRGVRLFVEVGPRGNLSAFVEDILRGRRFAALPANVARRSGLTQLNHLIGQLVAHHVPLDLAAYYHTRQPRLVARPVATPCAAVMEQYFAVMEQFLDLQQEMTEAFLRRPRRQARLPGPLVEAWEEDEPTEPELEPDRPLLGEIVRLVPGEEIVVRRRLDLDEDLFAHDHTVGGRAVSKVDPDQHGVPVMPMTFTLALLAETAVALVPGRVVTSVRNVRLLRWLAFDPLQPSVIEITVRPHHVEESGEVVVTGEVRDLGPADGNLADARLVAQGQVVLAADYPPAPSVSELSFTSEQPEPLTVEQVYHNLFHGPLFQGVTRVLRGGDEGVEAEAVVLPREGLFRSTANPTFAIDPVMLDVILHPLAAWHLTRPDLAGRIMLPVGVERFDFFAPPAPAGTPLLVRGLVTDANIRSFLHGGQAIGLDGRIHVRITGLRCWRFYVPFSENVNFHGPKDEYFLGSRWTEAEAEARAAGAGPGFALVRLEVPPDLKQAAMNQVTARVTMTAAEQEEFHRRTRANDGVHDWLFARIAGKDAIRLLWHDRTQERLFPADIECHQPRPGHYTAHRRGSPEVVYDPAVVVSTGKMVVALASRSASMGLGIALLGAGENEGAVRQRCAGEAVSTAASVAGPVQVEEGAAEGQFVVILAGERWRTYTARDGDLVVAWTLGERVPE